MKKKSRKVHPKRQKAALTQTAVYEAEQMKTSLSPGGEEEDYKDATVACQRTRTRSSCARMHASHRILGGTSKGAWKLLGRVFRGGEYSQRL